MEDLLSIVIIIVKLTWPANKVNYYEHDVTLFNKIN